MSDRPFSHALCTAGMIMLLAGCSSGGGSGGGVSSAPPPNFIPVAPPSAPSSQLATLLVRFDLQPRAIPSYVTTLRFTGLSAAGDVLYGPVVLPKQTEVTLTQVPTSVTRLRIEYLTGGAVRGVATIPVSLASGQTFTIDDPNFEDVAAVLTQLVVESPVTSVAAGFPVQLSARGTYNDGTQQDLSTSATWESSSPSVATVNERGLVTTLGPGTTVLRARYGNSTAEFTLNVAAAQLTAIRIDPPYLRLARGTSGTVRVIGTFSDQVERPVPGAEWSAGGGGFVSVTPAGVVQAQNIGTSSVTARVNQLTAQIPVEVTAAELSSVRIEPGSPTVAAFEQVSVQLVGVYTDQTTAPLTQTTWTSSDDLIASVLNDGRVTGKYPGSATLTATDTISGRQASVTITVTGSPIVSLSVTPNSPWLTKNQQTPLQVIGTYQDGSSRNVTPSVQFSSNNGHVTVSNAGETRGVISGQSGGTSLITVTYPGTTVTQQVSVRVVNYEHAATMDMPTTVSDMISSPDGRRLYVLGGGQLNVVDPATRQITTTLNLAGISFDLSPDGNTLLVCDATNTIRVVNTQNWNISTISAGQHAPIAVAFDGNNQAFALANETLLTLDVPARQLVRVLIDRSNLFYGGFLRVDSATRKLFVGQKGLSPSSVTRYAIGGSSLTAEQSERLGSNGLSLRINPGRGLIFACGGGNTVPDLLGYHLTYFPLTDLRTYLSVFRIGTYPRDAAFSPDGDVLFGINGSSYEHQVAIHRVDTGARVMTLPVNIQPIADTREIETTRDGRFVCLYTYDDYNDIEPRIWFWEQR